MTEEPAPSGDPNRTGDVFANRLPPPGADPLQTRVSGQEPDPVADAVRFFDPPLRRGSLGRLGHYELLDALGHGGFGVVYRAFDDSLQRPVAVKVLNPALAVSPAARARFVREARSAAPIRHENVVQVYAIAADPVPYIVMEYVPGSTLEGVLARGGALAPSEVSRIGAQIARGLGAAHALGLVHRDVKPGNIFLDADGGRVKVGDFGLARAADDVALTQNGVVAGTPLYMSPEQARGEPLDHRADLFSLGSVLYAMCTGSPPFDAPSTLAVLRKVIDDAPVPLRVAAPDAPAWLCRVVDKLLAKSPDDRYQSAVAVAEALTNPPPATDTRARTARHQNVPRPAPADGPEPVHELEPERPPESSRGAPRVLLFALVGAVALAAVGTGAYLLTRSDPKPQPDTARNPGADRPGPFPFPPLPKLPLPPPFPPAPAGPPTGEAFVNALGMRLVRVPKGLGYFGGGGGTLGGRAADFPADFYLSAFELTQRDWQEVTGANPSQFAPGGQFAELVKGLDAADLKRLPVDGVSFEQCQTFVARLNEKHPVSEWEYRLPTRDEWEYACRGGPAQKSVSGFDFYFTEPSTSPGKGANLKGVGPGRPQPVGSAAPNPLGLFDMHGNVAELCSDPAGGRAAVRGGSCLDAPEAGRAAAFNHIEPAETRAAVGLRVALVRKDAK